MDLISFHGKQSVKDFYVNRVKSHRDNDEIIKGTYWQNGRGCGIGCTIHGDEHSAYEDELGIPRLLARLEDRIFEGLPNDIAKDFPLRFLSAVPVGVDLEKSMVFEKFMHWLLVDDTHGVLQYGSKKGKVAIQAVADLYERKISGEEIEHREWKAAYAAAYDDDADAYAAADAGYAAYDDDDADAYAAACQKHRRAQADKLIELLENAENK